MGWHSLPNSGQPAGMYISNFTYTPMCAAMYGPVCGGRPRPPRLSWGFENSPSQKQATHVGRTLPCPPPLTLGLRRLISSRQGIPKSATKSLKNHNQLRRTRASFPHKHSGRSLLELWSFMRTANRHPPAHTGDCRDSASGICTWRTLHAPRTVLRRFAFSRGCPCSSGIFGAVPVPARRRESKFEMQ